MIFDGTEKTIWSLIENAQVIYPVLQWQAQAISGHNLHMLHDSASSHHSVRIFPITALTSPAHLQRACSQLQSPALYKSSARDSKHSGSKSYFMKPNQSGSKLLFNHKSHRQTNIHALIDTYIKHAQICQRITLKGLMACTSKISPSNSYQSN